ncbi:cell division protein FtsH, partial [Gordonia alkanivorans]|nr:cell division protein FtsH [Gordonia alkanivorans]
PVYPEPGAQGGPVPPGSGSPNPQYPDPQYPGAQYPGAQNPAPRYPNPQYPNPGQSAPPPGGPYTGGTRPDYGAPRDWSAPGWPPEQPSADRPASNGTNGWGRHGDNGNARTDSAGEGDDGRSS